MLGFLLFVFVAIYIGFKVFSQGLLLCSWVVLSFLVFDGMLMCFLMLLHTLFASVAMLLCCYAHGFFDLVLFLMVCCMLMGFLMLLHTWFAFAAMPMGLFILSCF